VTPPIVPSPEEFQKERNEMSDNEFSGTFDDPLQQPTTAETRYVSPEAAPQTLTYQLDKGLHYILSHQNGSVSAEELSQLSELTLCILEAHLRVVDRAVKRAISLRRNHDEAVASQAERPL